MVCISGYLQEVFWPVAILAESLPGLTRSHQTLQFLS